MNTYKVFGKLTGGKSYSYLITCESEAVARSIMFYEAAKFNIENSIKKFDIESIYTEKVGA